MLSDQVLELLTAFVDGELSQRQRKAVTRILQRSSEARDMLKQLQENAHKVKQLPRHKIEPSLVEQITQAIAEQQAQPKPAVRKARRGWLPYVAAAMAASVLIAAMGFAYWKAMEGGKDEGGTDPYAKGGPPNPKPIDAKSPPDDSGKKKKHPYLEGMVDGIAIGVGTPPEYPSYVFQELRDAKGAKIGHFAKHLNDAKTALRVDVKVSNNTLAMERLHAVLKERGVKVVIDPAVTRTLSDKQPKGKMEYLVFAENLIADDVAKLMSELSQEFVVGEGNNERRYQSPYQNLAVRPVGDYSMEQLAMHFGGDHGLKERDVTAKPAPKTTPSAVLLPGAAGPAPSAEVRLFVEQRRPQPGTLQIMIRICVE
jgi:hypothetical protein